MADPLTMADDALSPMHLAMADRPLEVPLAGAFPPGKTPPSRFLEWMPAPRAIQEPQAAGKSEPSPAQPPQTAQPARRGEPFAEGTKAITNALNSMHAAESGSGWVQTPEGGHGMYLRVRPNAIDISNLDFETKGTGAFRHYVNHIESEAQRLGIPIVNVENIFNPRLIPFFQSRGFKVVKPRAPMSMMKVLEQPRAGDE